jgi:predicted aldo/keto reductase-like oxidoreductase
MFEPVDRSERDGGAMSAHAHDTEPEPIFLATKVSHTEPDIRGSVERSLRNLRVDLIDLVQVHGGSYTEADEDSVMRRGGVLDILEKARDEGLISHIGFTTEDQNPAVYRFIASGRFEVMQVQYNLFFQHPYSPDRPFGGMIAARDAGMGIVTMRSLTSGVFQHWMRSVRPDDNFDYSAALLQFVLSNPLVNVALAGMRSMDEVDRNIAVLRDLSGRIDLDDLHEKYIQ